MKSSIESNRVAVLDVEDFDISLWLQIYHHKGKTITPALKGMMEEILHQLERIK